MYPFTQCTHTASRRLVKNVHSVIYPNSSPVPDADGTEIPPPLPAKRGVMLAPAPASESKRSLTEGQVPDIAPLASPSRTTGAHAAVVPAAKRMRKIKKRDLKIGEELGHGGKSMFIHCVQWRASLMRLVACLVSVLF